MNLSRLSALDGAAARFEEMYEQYEKREDLSDILQEAVKESLLQRFAYAVEVAWRAGKRYLFDVENYPRDIEPNTVYVACAKLHLLNDDNWLEYEQFRQDLSYNYSEDKAENLLALMPRFREDLRAFQKALAEKTRDAKEPE